MIKGDREDNGCEEQEDQNAVVISADNKQEKETNNQNNEFGGHDVGQNRAHKKPFLTLKKRKTVGAVMPYLKRLRHDSRFTARRTT
jgi:hypothetical protein